jgi:hypothetical protein
MEMVRNNSCERISDKQTNLAREGELGVEGGDFSASEGWLQKWKQRNNVRSYKINRKSRNVDLERAE